MSESAIRVEMMIFMTSSQVIEADDTMSSDHWQRTCAERVVPSCDVGKQGARKRGRFHMVNDPACRTALYCRGELSANEAAIEAGLRKKPTPFERVHKARDLSQPGHPNGHASLEP